MEGLCPRSQGEFAVEPGLVLSSVLFRTLAIALPTEARGGTTTGPGQQGPQSQWSPPCLP